MKQMMMLGAIIGLLIGICLGWTQGSAWPTILFQSSVAAYLAGLLMRWWGRVWLQSLEKAYTERLATSTEQTSTLGPNRAK